MHALFTERNNQDGGYRHIESRYNHYHAKRHPT